MRFDLRKKKPIRFLLLLFFFRSIRRLEKKVAEQKAAKAKPGANFGKFANSGEDFVRLPSLSRPPAG